MNLKNSGLLLFVLFVIVDAVNDSKINGAGSRGRSPSEVLTQSPEKSQVESQTEPIRIIPHDSEVISTPDPKKTTTTSTTTTTTTTTTTAATTTNDTTTTTPAPAPTLPPIVIPAPEKGTWVVRNETTNTTCVIAEMAMQLNVTYPVKDKMMSGILNIPKNATVQGDCGEPSQRMVIQWKPGHTLMINFVANKTANNFYVNELSLKVNATVFKDSNASGMWNFVNHSSEFKTPLKMSYKCNKEQDLTLESESPDLKAVLSLKDTQIEAFMNKTKAEFGAAQDCDPFDTPDIVPIAVGCALAILVLVVLVAYLIGRRRSQNRGYLSM